jgi:uncharacterized phage-like protein YoqJ
MSTEKTCAFTGHRRLAKADIPVLKKKLEETIESLINQGVYRYLSGGAVGWDTLAAKVILDFKAGNEAIKLIMVLPCRNQDEKWSAEDKAVYKEHLAAADEIVYGSEGYTADCMKKRNIRLVDDSDYCIAYMKHQRSGSSQTVRLAKEKGIPVFNLADDD